MLCLVLTLQKVENPCSGRAVDRIIGNAVQQSQFDEETFFKTFFSLAILLQTSLASWQNSNSDIIILSFNV